ncbi:MAG: PilX N-terminal domain-containing pilus assembly protein [Desulfobacteraceae bacterium]|jgi:hypothetical protein
MASVVATVKSSTDGYVLLMTLFLLLLLTIIGIAATHTASVEVQISGNNKTMVEDFYVAEGALITVLENSEWWLGDLLGHGGGADGYWSGSVNIDGDDIDDAYVEIRCVDRSSSNIAALSQAANSIPCDSHIAPPPRDSGFSVRHFKIRKYAVTASDLRSGIDIQSGVWKVFNTFE